MRRFEQSFSENKLPELIHTAFCLIVSVIFMMPLQHSTEDHTAPQSQCVAMTLEEGFP